MRVKIVKALRGHLDGMPLEQFELGKTYDVSPSFATYLLVTGSAAPVPDVAPALVTPLDINPKKSRRKKR